MHAIKIKQSEFRGLLNHDMRVGDNHSNEDIDPKLSPLNYNLHSGNPFDNVSKRLDELTYLKMNKANILVSWVVTLPKELETEAERVKFFEVMYEFLSKRYGRENVVSAIVHMDETKGQPHMHFKFVPATLVNGVEKLSCRTVLTRTDLKSIHTDTEKLCRKVFGMEKLILNGATVGGNKTVKELKLQELEKKLTEKNKELESVISKVETLNEDLPAEKPLHEPKKGLLGSVVTVKAHNALVNEFNGLLALERDRQRSVNLWKSQFEDEKKRYKALESDFEAFKRLDMPKDVLTLREANLSLKNDNRQLQKQLEELVDDNKVLKEDLEVYKGFFDNFFGALQKASQSVIDMIEPYIPMNFKEWFYRAFRGFERD